MNNSLKVDESYKSGLFKSLSEKIDSAKSNFFNKLIESRKVVIIKYQLIGRNRKGR